MKKFNALEVSDLSVCLDRLLLAGKSWLKCHIQKIKIMASGPITSWQIDRQWKQWQTLFWGAPKSLQIVTKAMKLKDACSLEEKL